MPRNGSHSQNFCVVCNTKIIRKSHMTTDYYMRLRTCNKKECRTYLLYSRGDDNVDDEIKNNVEIAKKGLWGHYLNHEHVKDDEAY